MTDTPSKPHASGRYRWVLSPHHLVHLQESMDVQRHHVCVSWRSPHGRSPINEGIWRKYEEIGRKYKEICGEWWSNMFPYTWAVRHQCLLQKSLLTTSKLKSWEAARHKKSERERERECVRERERERARERNSHRSSGNRNMFHVMSCIALFIFVSYENLLYISINMKEYEENMKK